MIEVEFDEDRVVLQELKIPAGWCLQINQFYNVDPSLYKSISKEEVLEAVFDYFEQDMFYAENRGVKKAIDLGWAYKAGEKANGQFVLQYLLLKENGSDYVADYDSPLEKLKFYSLSDVVEKLNSLLAK